jgi:hypothetical protein
MTAVQANLFQVRAHRVAYRHQDLGANPVSVVPRISQRFTIRNRVSVAMPHTYAVRPGPPDQSENIPQDSEILSTSTG